MILDKLENSRLYANLGERFGKAFEYLNGLNFENTPPGKYVIEGDEIHSSVMEYETRDESDCKIEAHKKYADIQYIVSGSEKIGIAMLRNQSPKAEYNDQKDVWFFNEYDFQIRLIKGMFAVFFPDDIHMPSLKDGEKSLVKKVVIKVKL